MAAISSAFCAIPGQYWGLLLFAAVIFSLIIAGIAVNRRLAVTTSG